MKDDCESCRWYKREAPNRRMYFLSWAGRYVDIALRGLEAAINGEYIYESEFRALVFYRKDTFDVRESFLLNEALLPLFEARSDF
jgi:hypothetical protein